MTAADKLIADRGHGLSRLQKTVLANTVSAAGVGVDDFYPYTARDWCSGRVVTRTVQSLAKLGLVERSDVLEPGWPLRYRLVLTSAGRALLDRMGGAR